MLIGLDIGTTNVKAVAFEGSRILAASERPNRVLTPQPGWSEQEPEAVFQHVLSVLRAVKSRVTDPRFARHQAIVFSSAMHGLVAVDTAGRPLTRFILWSDLRSGDIARQLRESPEGRELYRRTGVPIHAMSPLVKSIWLRRNQPEVFAQAHRFLGIKDYVWYRLTGDYRCDWSVASATGMFNLVKNDWDEGALTLAGLTPAQLPEPVSPLYLTRLSENAQLWRESSGNTDLIIGASDGALANLGSGATGPGQVAVTIGTSAAIRTVTAAPVADEQMRTFCYRLDGERFIVGGASNNGTNVLEWLRGAVFRSSLSADAFASQALGVAPGADGLLFLPYLYGERAPLYDTEARGAFFGLTAGHGQAHFVRAALEGVILNLRLIAETLEAQEPIRTLYAGGGFSRNELWVQLLADIFQKPVMLSESGADASVLGAVQMGRKAMGLPENIENEAGRVVGPAPDKGEIYADVFRRFKSLVAKR